MEPISVTDHALVRFIERVVGMDLEQFRDMVRADIEGVNREPLPCEARRYAYVIEDGRVITVLMGEMKVKKTSKTRGQLIIER